MILNALDLLLSSSEYSSSKSFSSNKTTYHFTKSSNSFSLHDSYPFEDLNWGLIGTKDAITFLHRCKVWYLMCPKLGLSPLCKQSLSSHHMFLDHIFRFMCWTAYSMILSDCFDSRGFSASFIFDMHSWYLIFNFA